MQAFARAASAASLCAAMLPAQPTSPARDLGFGMVRQSDGTPWAGALVQLVHRPDPELLDESITDRIEVFTDERGRFRAELLDGARYAVWARAPLPDALGRYRATASAALEVRSPVVFDESEPRFARRIRVVPDPSWEGHEELRLFATAGDSGLGPGRWLNAEEGGVYRVPPGPDDRLHLELYAAGWRVHRTAVALSTAGLSMGELASDDQRATPPRDAAMLGTVDGAAVLLGQEFALRVPPRQVRAHRMTHHGSGAPVRDAVALVEPAPAGAPLPRSDADGQLDVVFASEVDVVDGTRVRATVAGNTTECFQVSSAGWSLGVRSVDRQMSAGFGVRGRLVMAGLALREMPLRAWIVNPDQRTFSGRSQIVRTDRDGNFAILGLSEGERLSLTAVLPVAVRERLSRLQQDEVEHRGESTAPIAPLVGLADVSSTPAPVFGTLDLTDLRFVRVSVTGNGGSPAGGVDVWCCTAPPDATRISPPIAYRTSRHGTLRIACRKDSQPGLVAEASGMVAAVRLARSQRDVDLVLDARTIARLRLLDQTGAPVVGRKLSVLPASGAHGLGTETDGPLAAALRHALRGRPDPITDDEGTAQVSLQGREGNFIVLVQDGAQRNRVVGVLQLDPDREPRQILKVRMEEDR